MSEVLAVCSYELNRRASVTDEGVEESIYYACGQYGASNGHVDL